MGQIDFNKVWQNFLDTITNHYSDFGGRIPRAQYWFFMLVCAGLFIAAAILDGIIGRGLLVAVLNLALLLPVGGMSARRMQDTGQNGQIAWIYVIVGAIYGVFGLLIALSGPFGALGFLIFFFTFGWLIQLGFVVVIIGLVYFCVQPGTAGDNAYGPPPPVWTPGPPTV